MACYLLAEECRRAYSRHLNILPPAISMPQPRPLPLQVPFHETAVLALCQAPFFVLTNLTLCELPLLQVLSDDPSILSPGQEI